MPSVDSIRNARLIRAIKALRGDACAKNRTGLADAILESMLLVEAKLDPEGEYHLLSHRMGNGEREQPVFTDVTAYRAWRHAPRRRALIGREGGRLLEEIIHSRAISVVTINPKGPTTLRLPCSGAALFFHGRPVFWV